MLHSSCAPSGNASELSCHSSSVCCRSPGKREVAFEVFVVGVAGGADEELTMAVLVCGEGREGVTRKCSFQEW